MGTLPLNSTSWAVPYAATTGLLTKRKFNDEKNTMIFIGGRLSLVENNGVKSSG